MQCDAECCSVLHCVAVCCRAVYCSAVCSSETYAVMTLSYVSRDSSTRVTWHSHMRDMNHSYVWHDSFIRETWLFHTCDMTHLYVWHHIYDTTHDTTHPNMWHDSSIRGTWLIHTHDMTYLYVWYDWFIRMTWFILTCDMTHSDVWHDSFWRVTRLRSLFILVVINGYAANLVAFLVKKRACVVSDDRYSRRLLPWAPCVCPHVCCPWTDHERNFSQFEGRVCVCVCV